jgi:hypothetical protein
MKQGERNVFLIAKYPVKMYFDAKVMMYEFVLVTKQTIYVNDIEFVCMHVQLRVRLQVTFETMIF